MEIITIPDALNPNGNNVTITKIIANPKSKPKCPKRFDTISAWSKFFISLMFAGNSLANASTIGKYSF